MIQAHRGLLWVPVLLGASAGCNGPQTPSEVQMSKMETMKEQYGTHHDSMVDNAALRDMSVADIHFIPHTAEISGIGEARLNRLAKLLHTYGGILRYETLLQDEKLVKHRLDHVREYLALTGCNMERVEIAAMMSGGHGLPGDEAVAKYVKGTASEQSGQGQRMSFTPGMFAPAQGR